MASDVSGEVEFDHIAPVYDETRSPPSEAEVEALVGLLEGARKVLDAGIGTGRFAVPLSAHGFEIVGVDLSLGMMRQARGKGIRTLVRADVRRLPLRDRVVDAAFMAHVLQLIADPRPVLQDLGRVARRSVLVLLPNWSEPGTAGEWRELRERYRAIAAELGYPLPERGKRYLHSLEELSAITPPQSIREVTGPPPSSRTTEERLARWESRTSAGREIPPEVRAEIVRRLREEQNSGPSAWSRPRTTRFVTWSAEGLRGTT